MNRLEIIEHDIILFKEYLERDKTLTYVQQLLILDNLEYLLKVLESKSGSCE